ncbi:D(1)-like dopamine receptor [Festucalex cinctus]
MQATRDAEDRDDSDEVARHRDVSVGRLLTGLVLFALIVSTLLGNALVCAAVVKFRHLRSKVTNSFVISLAVSDLFVAVLVMPWRAVSEVAGAWLFGRFFCDTWVACDIMCSTASILNLCIISMDRYWAISSPFRYERKMTRRFALLMIGVAWTLSVLISFIPVQLNWHRDDVVVGALPPTTTPTDDCNASLNRTYAIASSLISFYIPVLIMVGTYTRIFRIAQTQIRRISSLERAPTSPPVAHDESALKSSFKRETKVLKTLSIIMGVFVFCWLPFFVLNCLVPFCQQADSAPCVSDTTFSIFVWFGWANSSLNPVIYAFNADFRRAFATILGCNRLCCAASSAVEAVDFSDQMVSYHHDTTLHKEVAGVGTACSPTQQHGFDRVSLQGSDDSRNRAAILQSRCEADISLDMTPFADPCAVPGHVQDL